MLPITQTYYKPTKKIFLIFFAFPVIGYFIYRANETQPNNYVLLLTSIPFMIGMIAYFLLSKVYVMIDDHGITYKNAFREKFMAWENLSRTYIKIRHTGKTAHRYWMLEGKDGTEFSFSSNMYNRNSMRGIAEAIVNKAPHADIQQRIREMAAGKFKWYVF
jgi:hypothetical protein